MSWDSVRKLKEKPFDITLGTDKQYSGLTCGITIGYASAAFGDLVYLNNVNNRWEKANASTEGTSGDVMLGLVVSADVSDGGAGVILLIGFIKKVTWNFSSAGDTLYASETEGLITAVRPTASNAIVRVIGNADINTNTVYFNPSGTWVELS